MIRQRLRPCWPKPATPMGLDMILHAPNSGNFPDLTQALASQWEEAGIRVEIQLEDENTYWSELWDQVDLGTTGWGARPIPQLFLDLAYHSEGTLERIALQQCAR